MVIPDKRYTFDVTRELTTPSQVLGAYWDAHTRPTSASMYEYISEYRKNVDVGEAWANPGKDFSNHPRRYTREEAVEMCQENKKGIYVDCHCFVYTPSSFVTILRALMQHELLDFEVASFRNTPENDLEFYVSLRKIDPAAKGREAQLATLPDEAALASSAS